MEPRRRCRQNDLLNPHLGPVCRRHGEKQAEGTACTPCLRQKWPKTVSCPPPTPEETLPGKRTRLPKMWKKMATIYPCSAPPKSCKTTAGPACPPKTWREKKKFRSIKWATKPNQKNPPKSSASTTLQTGSAPNKATKTTKRKSTFTKTTGLPN